jgi:hypothetical protein
MRVFTLVALLSLGSGVVLPTATAYPPGRPIPVTDVTIPVTFTFNGEVGKVRTQVLPPKFNDKGKPAKYTKAELQALKGDTKAEKRLPGYTAEYSDLKVGDTVQVTISMLKGGTKPKKAGKEKEGDADPAAKPAKAGKWVVTQQLVGKVAKVSGGNTDADATMTIHVKNRVLGKAAGNAQNQTFDPEKYAATQIVIVARANP